MAAQNANDLSKFVGILEVAPLATPTAFTRLACVRGLTSNFDNTVNSVEVKADDCGTVLKGFTPEGRVEGVFLENANRDVMTLILGGTASNAAGTPVTGATQTVTNPSAYLKYIELENQNNSGAVPTITAVSGSIDGALVAGTDYSTIQDSSGQWGIYFISGGAITTLTQVFTITYDYTPSASESWTETMEFNEAPDLVVRITATDDNGLIRRVTLSSATFEGIYGLEFLDVVEAGDLTGTTFVFKTNLGSTFTYYNEIL